MAASGDEISVEIRVELKAGVFDAEADSVERSLRQLGISGVARAQTARVFRLTFQGVSESGARERAQVAVDRLLANPVIHRVDVRVLPR